MGQDEKKRITELLSIWNESKQESLSQTFDKAYTDLQRIARKAKRDLLSDNKGEIKATEGLIHDLFIKLSESDSLSFENPKFYGFENRGKFYALCRLTIRGILHDYLKKKSTQKEEATDYESETIKERINSLSLEKFESEYNYHELCMFTEKILPQIAKISPKYQTAVDMIYSKIECGSTNEEIARDYNTSESEVTRNITLVRARLKYEIGVFKPILDKAVDITNTTQRNIFIKESCAGDKSLLKSLEIILKQLLEK